MRYWLRWLSALVILFLALTGAAPATLAQGSEDQEGTLEYKNYVVRYDRGWDVLCEPYKIQKNDWVLKIFRQKGEIAHKDFRDFLGIFKRLNPHIKDVNRIRTGQMIDIPLRKVPPGGLPGQSSGIVTIPFVSITEVVHLLNSQSETYMIQRGDTISQLLAERFGAYGSTTYAEGVKMLKALNPNITDVNKIYAGQQIYLPSPEVRQQPWYRSIFDAEGNIVKEVPAPSRPKPQPTDTESAPVFTAAQPARPPVSEAPKPKTNIEAISAAARMLNASLQKKGTYYFPVENRPDVELDLSRYPLMELQGGKRLILNTEDKVMGFEPQILDALLKNASVIDLPENPTTAQVLERVLAGGGASSGPSEGLRVSIPGVEIHVAAKWIETITDTGDGSQRHICITPIQSEAERTPEAIVRYLDQHNIVLREILGSKLTLTDTAQGNGLQRFPVEEFLAAGDQQAFISQLAQSMGFTYSPNVTISFPYAGIQVKAMSNLLSTGKGSELLVDYGDLYGDAITSIKKTGLRIVQIEVGDPAPDIITKVLKGLGLNHSVNPHYLAAKRSTEYNTTITINGFECHKGGNEKVLIATNALPARILSFLKQKGLKVILLGG